MPPDTRAFRRHDFVTLAADWRDCEAGPRSQSCADMIEAWRAAGRPFVVTRRLEEDEPHIVRLGLATPAKLRVGFAVDRASVSAHQPPPLLSEAVICMPPDWQRVVEQLMAFESQWGVAIRVFGSAAWQTLTHLQYLRASSDLDLVLSPPPTVDLVELALALATVTVKPRLDGEFVLPNGAAVAWRELAQRPQRILVKFPAGVALRPLGELLSPGGHP